MSKHGDLAEIRKASTNPLNFTCGRCKKVSKFVEGYVCPECNYCAPDGQVKEA